MCKVGVLFLSCVVVCTWSFSSLPPGASCSSDEAELAGKRLQTLVALDSVYKSFSASETFSLNSFLSQLSLIFTPEISITISHGIGDFVGLNDAAEYLALRFSSVNVGLFAFNDSDTAGVPPTVSVDGDAYTLGATATVTFFPTATPSLRLQHLYTEVVATFAPCRSRCTTALTAHTPTHCTPGHASIERIGR
jgi:hypothetical protein